MNVILMGPPGAGKGTQAEKIKAKLSVPHISTGDMFRKAVSEGTEMGKKAKEYMDKGSLVPDEVTIGIVRDRLGESDCAKGFLLDGFPRTVKQAQALESIMAELGKKIDAVINIETPDEILVMRISGRVSCKNCKSVYNVAFNPPAVEGKCDKCGGELLRRSDDNEETVRARLKTYMEETFPVLAFYEKQGNLYNIDGDDETERVFLKIDKVFLNLSGKS